MSNYDLVVIGAGTGGYVAAIRAAQLGLRVAVVEKQASLGGTCLNWGCIPTKALLEHAHALKVAQEASEWGIDIGGATPAISMPKVHARKDKVVKGLTRGIEFLFKKNKIDWIRGTGRLAGKGKVDVEPADAKAAAQSLNGKHILVATGSQPRGVPGIEIDRTTIITSDEAIHLAEVPKRLAIMGSGAVGVEFASIFRRFGSDVTIIELLPRLVPVEDEAVSAELEKSFRKQGIKVMTGTKATGAKPGSAGVTLTLEKDGKTSTLEVDKLLVATGRGPVTAGLGAEEAGLALERGYVKVAPDYSTGVPGIWAIGDVITFDQPGHPQLAHLSSAEGIVLAERIVGKEPPAINYDQVPGCTYCDPEIGSIGLTEQEAKTRGYDVAIGVFPFGVLGRAKIAGETDGFVKIVAEKKYDEVLGVHMIGPRATELVAAAGIALRTEATVEEIIRTIHAHPTMSEAIGEAAHAVHGAAIHS
ncbi:MAG TPA: dihydrolipoyl dehydrogenase [Vicinamibacterales bacterium]|nr:dihydrolipoyl dehydrogenase [Vicinamibacterales bacterium]